MEHERFPVVRFKMDRKHEIYLERQEQNCYKKHAPIQPTRGHYFNYPCACGEQFITQDILRHHIISYRQRWLWKCERCEFKFPSLKCLCDHIQNVHKLQNPHKNMYGCCGILYESKADLLEKHLGSGVCFRDPIVRELFHWDDSKYNSVLHRRLKEAEDLRKNKDEKEEEKAEPTKKKCRRF